MLKNVFLRLKLKMVNNIKYNTTCKDTEDISFLKLDIPILHVSYCELKLMY